MAGEAARRRDPAQLKHMQDALDRAAAADQDLAYGAAIRDFHNALFDAPGGELLGLLYDALHQIVALRVRRKISLSEAREWLGEHQAILDAIAGGDVEQATFLAGDHLAKVDRRFERAMPGLLGETITWA
jgi:DNA-binding FadR family transcriptional regulator